MKETTTVPTDKVVQIQLEQHAKKPVLIHRMRPKKGQTLYEYSITENTLKKAGFAQPGTVKFTEVQKGNVSSIAKRVDVKQDHLYICAINFKNAVKQVKKFDASINPVIVK